VAETSRNSVHTSHSAPRSHRRRGLWAGKRGRALVLAISLAIGLGGYVLGLELAHRDIAATSQLIQQLRAESQRLNKQVSEQAAAYAALQAKFASVQSAMNTMKPAQNTYDIKPNQSIIVADGHLTIGLIGSPANDSIDININGKRQSAAPGDIINVAPDASTACQVAIQSFDMFHAMITASCAAAKPQ
jgi:hypothetical protein